MRTYFLQLYDWLYIFLNGVEYSRVILALKIISWMVSYLLIFVIVVLLKRSDAGWQMRERAYARKFAYGSKPDEKWQKVLARLERGDEANLKLAVIEADSVMDDVLQRMSLPGKNMEEKLKQFEKHELASIDLVWSARNLRNLIVREPSMRITKEQAETAIKGYESALKEWEYL